MKRVCDAALAAVGLLVLAPLGAVIAWLIWLEDRGSPWYWGKRIGAGGAPFRMLKFRTMRVDAWKSGVNSTAADDRRITRTGRWLRRAKLDELPQLWNVLLGHMSLVGPRPQVESEAALYTGEERRMLAARPGLTDVASIVFSDEGDILASAAEPDLLYNQIIRPWKSRLVLLYLDRRDGWTDLKLIGLTLVALLSRPLALAGVAALLRSWHAPALLRRMAGRREPLLPYPPPGAAEVVSHCHASAASGGPARA